MRQTLFLLLFFSFGSGLWAQSGSIRMPEFGVEYIAEGQSDRHQELRLVNYLKLDLSLPMGKYANFDIATISVRNDTEKRIADDLQVFSNIEADNIPLTLAELGIRLTFSKGNTMFVGIRNINEDYFTSDITAFYTNSSCGVFPTIAANFDIANYPVAGPAVHYCYQSEQFSAQTSLYEGLFAITLAEYDYSARQEASNRNGQIFAGACLHTRGNKQSAAGALWTYIEHPICQRFALIAGYSRAIGRNLPCTDFAGFGIDFHANNTEIGLYSNYASFRLENTEKTATHKVNEFATEITAKFTFADYLYLQPALHLISTDRKFAPVFALRFGFEY